jgi:hypothetical protein
MKSEEQSGSGGNDLAREQVDSLLIVNDLKHGAGASVKIGL